MASGTWDNGDSGSGTWEFDESSATLIISGSGIMPNYTSSTTSSQPWYDVRQDTKILIITGVTQIGDYSFNDMSNLEEVEIGDSVKYIGNPDASLGGHVFQQSNLKKIVFGHSVEFIGYQSFWYCSKLVNIYFKGSQPTMGGSEAKFGSNTIYMYDNFELGTGSSNHVTATVYTTGWGSDEVFTSPVRGDYTTFIYETWTPPEPESKSPEIPVNVSGSWKSSTPYVNVDGTWKEVTAVYVNVDGTWKETK